MEGLSPIAQRSTAELDWRALQDLAGSVRAAAMGSGTADAKLDVTRAARVLRCALLPIDQKDAAEGNFLAALVPLVSGEDLFEVRYRSDLPDTQARFSIAHELGHTFFFDKTTRPARRLRPSGSALEERYCEEFAAELLVPSSLLPPKPTISGLVMCSKSLGASSEVVTRQALQHDAFPWAAVFGVRFVGKPSEPTAIAPRVVWVASRPGSFVPLWARLRDIPEGFWGQRARSFRWSSRSPLGSIRRGCVYEGIPVSQSGAVVGVGG